jgi:Ca2+-binding EF-hand superfamily protein
MPSAERPGPADFVTRLDRNHDQRVTPDEFDGPPEHFSRFDRNQDGVITATEAPQGPPPGGW